MRSQLVTALPGAPIGVLGLLLIVFAGRQRKLVVVVAMIGALIIVWM